MVWQKFTNNRPAVMKFIAAAQDDTRWSSPAGYLFENLAHDILREGGDFQIQQIHIDFSKFNKKQSRAAGFSLFSLRLSPVACQIDQVADIANVQNDQYGQTLKSNFPTIDGLRKPVHLFQMTVGKTHSVNVAGLKATADKMYDRRQNVRLYFVVPPNKFSTFTVGSFTDKTAIPSYVEYWVLQLYESQSLHQH